MMSESELRGLLDQANRNIAVLEGKTRLSFKAKMVNLRYWHWKAEKITEALESH